jgi:hypothetical protein
MSRLMLVAAAVLISSAALAQTKDQCGTVASVLVPVISYIVPLEESNFNKLGLGYSQFVRAIQELGRGG